MPLKGGEPRTWGRDNRDVVATKIKEPGWFGRLRGQKPIVEEEERYTNPPDMGQVETYVDRGVIDRMAAVASTIRNAPANLLEYIKPKNVLERTITNYKQMRYGELDKEITILRRNWEQLKQRAPNLSKQQAEKDMTEKFRTLDERLIAIDLAPKYGINNNGEQMFKELLTIAGQYGWMYGVGKDDRDGKYDRDGQMRIALRLRGIVMDEVKIFNQRKKRGSFS